MIVKKRLSDSETVILKILWERGEPLCVNQVIELLKERKIEWAYTTVATFLKRMENKGFVTSEKRGRAYYYSAAVKEGEITTGPVKYVEKFFRGSLNEFLAAFTKEKGMTEEDLEELREWVEQYRNSNK